MAPPIIARVITARDIIARGITARGITAHAWHHVWIVVACARQWHRF
jgi:hypothetical protein